MLKIHKNRYDELMYNWRSVESGYTSGKQWAKQRDLENKLSDYSDLCECGFSHPHGERYKTTRKDKFPLICPNCGNQRKLEVQKTKDQMVYKYSCETCGKIEREVKAR